MISKFRQLCSSADIRRLGNKLTSKGFRFRFKCHKPKTPQPYSHFMGEIKGTVTILPEAILGTGYSDPKDYASVLESLSNTLFITASEVGLIAVAWTPTIIKFYKI